MVDRLRKITVSAQRQRLSGGVSTRESGTVAAKKRRFLGVPVVPDAEDFFALFVMPLLETVGAS
ncbi:MAG: hypothetical protein WB775_07825 [Burkholderiaceae bacterium]|jgi:hypothetical protein